MTPTEPETALHHGDFGEIEGYVADRVIFQHYRTHDTWSPSVLKLLLTLLDDRAGTLIDVGANIGLVSIPVAQRSRAQVHALEPEPRNFRLLQRNVRHQGLGRRISIHPWAADEQDRVVYMQRSLDNYGDHHIPSTGTVNAKTGIPIQARPLDHLLTAVGQELPRPLVVKIDTQGYEDKVLQGGQRLLTQADAVILEYWPSGVRRAGGDLNLLHERLCSFARGAILSPSESDSLPELHPTATLCKALEEQFADRNPGFVDLLLMP